MSAKAPKRKSASDGIWAAVKGVAEVARDPDLLSAWDRVERIRRSRRGHRPSTIRAWLKTQGLEVGRDAPLQNALTKAAALVQICAPERQAAQDLDDILAIFAIALANPDLAERAEASAESRSARKAEGAEQMDENAKAHVEALTEAELDEQRFKEALKALFADRSLDAKGRKAVAEQVTRSPAKLLGSDQARKDELERWFYEKRRRAGRARTRAMETSRF